MHLSFILLAAAATILSATKLECSQHLFEGFVSRTPPGDVKSCLLSNIDVGRLDEIEQCFTVDGSSKVVAKNRARRSVHECAIKGQDNEERLSFQGRAVSTTFASSTKTTPAKRTESSAATTSSSSSDTASSTTGTSWSTGTGTMCSTTHMISTSYCTSTGATTTCTPTTVAVASCGPGLFCTETAKVDYCMRKDNTLGVAGYIIAIVFGIGILSVMLRLVITGLIGKRAAKKREVESEALLSAYKTKAKGNAPDLEAYDPPLESQAHNPFIVEPEGAEHNI